MLYDMLGENPFPTTNMKKTIGVLCLATFLASLGWKLTQSSMMVSDSGLVDVGYLRVRDGSVLEFKNGATTLASGSGRYSIVNPLNYKIELGIYIAASAACLLAAIELLKKGKA
jgi:hypothetical protein